MAVRTLLKMGDPRLLRTAQPVTAWDTPALHSLVADLHDTMRAAQGAGLAAPQIGEDWQVVVFGSESANPRYPGRAVVPPTVLINPRITPLGAQEQEDWEGCLSVPTIYDAVQRHAKSLLLIERHAQNQRRFVKLGKLIEQGTQIVRATNDAGDVGSSNKKCPQSVIGRPAIGG